MFRKIKHEDTDFSSHQRDWKKFEQNNESIDFNVLFTLQNSEEITFVHEPEHIFKRESNVPLLMINGDDEKCYFAVKSKLELYSSELLRSKKESITKGDNNLQTAVDDALDYQRIKKDRKKYQNLSHMFSQYNWTDIKCPSNK